MGGAMPPQQKSRDKIMSKTNVIQQINNIVATIAYWEKKGNDEVADTWRDKLEDIEREKLPSGSGFNAGTQISGRSKPNKIILETGFLHHDEYGGELGWTEHLITITPDLTHDFNIKIRTIEDKRCKKESLRGNGFLEYMETEFRDELKESM